MMLPPKLVVVAAVALFASTLGSGPAVPPQPALPGGQLAFGAFHVRFVPDGTFVLEGDGWPPFKGTWKQEGAHIALLTPAHAGRAATRPAATTRSSTART